ncbi:phage tail protein [Pseudomonas sp.]|uniref:phage tail protein n=1 Tax=Pseudomonas sp. TaxID=306 RepID=UPI0032656352
MAVKLPNGATFEHAATYATALAFSAISNASEAVCTVTGGTLAVGDILLVASGWTALNNKVVRVKTATATAITLEAIDTTDTTVYPAGSGVGTLRKVLTWVQIPQVTDFASAGGQQNYAEVSFLEAQQGFQIPTDKSAASMTITVADDPALPYMPIVTAADTSRSIQAARLNLPGVDKIYYGVFTSISPQPTIQRNNVMTKVVSLAQQSTPTRYLS